ncbi:MAG: decarboxylase [Candidatus Woesearchaeota archaeon]|jgi:ornithine decarboxylase|nr:decarboxylase [Candidatus Woesearchaeota archaeon]
MERPKFVLSKSKALEQYKIIKKTADIISYSSKTNPIVTSILEENTNSLFSIHITNELKRIKDKSRVIFLAQTWNTELIDKLIKQGISKFIVDNENDLDILLNYLKEKDTKIELMLRVKLKENSIRTEKYFVFGMPSEIVSKKIKELKGNPNITSLGIHFHRKTQNMAEWNLTYEVSNMFDKDTLENINVLNIGGGLPSTYANTNVDVFNSIFKRINELKDFLNKNNTKLMIEPGRFIAAPAIKLITYIKGIYENNIIVNASIYNSNLDALIVPVKLIVEGELSKEKGKPYVIKGETPCSMDLFRYRVYLNNPKVGDGIIFLNAGAYNFASEFCDLEKIETEIII